MIESVYKNKFCDKFVSKAKLCMEQITDDHSIYNKYFPKHKVQRPLFETVLLICIWFYLISIGYTAH